jgi:hypothetical protein
VTVFKILSSTILLLAILVLWLAYYKISKKSYELEIRNDPYRRPVFFLCCLATVGFLLIISDIVFEWTG